MAPRSQFQRLDRATNGALKTLMVEARAREESWTTVALQVHDKYGIDYDPDTYRRWWNNQIEPTLPQPESAAQ